MLKKIFDVIYKKDVQTPILYPSYQTKNGYIIESEQPLNDEILSSIDELLYEFDPITYQFKLGQSTIKILDNITHETNMNVFGSTSGELDSRGVQHITIKTGYTHVLTHELGHVVDRYGDGQLNVALSRHPEFSNITQPYREQVLKRSTSNNLNYETDEYEVFAYLFEQYCKDILPHISLTQQTSTNLSGTIAEELYQKDPSIKHFFDDKLKFLTKRIVQEKFALKDEDLKLPERSDLSL